MKIAVPAYFGPWQQTDWSLLIAARPAIAVINPASGPGDRRHPGYRQLVRKLASAHCTVLGYVHTSWLQRPLHEIAQAVDRYRDWYGVTGLLLDEIALEPSSLRLLRQLLATFPEPTTLVLNPGRSVPPSWQTAIPSASWITFEGSARTYLDRRKSVGRARPGTSKQWHLVHSVPKSLERAVIERIGIEQPGFGYVTADRLPNPWDVFDARLVDSLRQVPSVSVEEFVPVANDRPPNRQP